nr:SpoIIE family protein phosphatase [Streptomyces mirabilis]
MCLVCRVYRSVQILRCARSGSRSWNKLGSAAAACCNRQQRLWGVLCDRQELAWPSRDNRTRTATPRSWVNRQSGIPVCSGTCRPPLGAPVSDAFESERVPLPPGSLIALYTDGLHRKPRPRTGPRPGPTGPRTRLAIHSARPVTMSSANCRNGAPPGWRPTALRRAGEDRPADRRHVRRAPAMVYGHFDEATAVPRQPKKTMATNP